MKVLNSVVTKLWLTIILIVTTVLIIVTILLSFYMRNYMLNNLNDQLIGDIARVEDEILTEHDIDRLNETVQKYNNILIYFDNQFISSIDSEILNNREELLAQSNDNESFIFEDNGESFLVQSRNLSEFFDSRLHIFKYENLNDIGESLRAIIGIFLISGFILFATTTIFAFFLISRITGPLTRLKASAMETAKGNYSNLKVKSRDEIGELTLAFNKMNNEISHNINQLKRERNLREKIFNSIHEGIIFFDANDTVQYKNKYGNDFYHLACKGNIPDLDLDDYISQTRKDLSQRNTVVEYHNQFVMIHIIPLIIENKFIGSVVVIRNITEQVNQENMRSEFITNLSHELRTPMVMLNGYSEALLDDVVTDPKEVKEVVSIIKDETVRLNQMINELITISRLDGNTMEYHFEHYYLRNLFSKVHKYFDKMMKDNQIHFNIQIENHIQFTYDEDKLYQVIVNLIDNSLRYTLPNDEISLQASEDSSCVYIYVRDTGTGIEKEHIHKIFERFYKVDEARTRGKHGTGLGLYICKNIIERHDGTIKVESVFGQGTTFIIQIPKRKK